MSMMLFRVIILLVMMTYLAFAIFGFGYTQTLAAITELADPYLKVLFEEISQTNSINLVFLVLGFLFRRTILLLLKETGVLFGILLLPKRFRVWLAKKLAFPKEYSGRVWGRMNHWYDRRFGVAFANWLRALKFSTAIFALSVVCIEVFLAIVYGALLLPEIFLVYKTEILRAIGSTILGSVAQWLILFIWKLLKRMVPKRVKKIVVRPKRRVFRVVIRLRYRLIPVRYRMPNKKTSKRD